MKKINAQDFYNSKQNAIIVDVRTPEEYKKGHIENAILVPIDTFEQNIEKEVPERGANVYIYCFSGSRSSVAAQILQNKGYTNISDLEHGLLGWRAKNLPLVS